MKWSVVPAVVVLAMMSAQSGSAQLPDLDDLMRQKLGHGQDLLEAVVMGDHVSVVRYANELTLLSEASTWTSLRSPQYLQFAANFRDSARSLVDEARERDMERVAFAYTELITTCVQCHRHVRGAQQAN